MTNSENSIIITVVRIMKKGRNTRWKEELEPFQGGCVAQL